MSSKVDDFPLEIWQEIYMYCLPDDRNTAPHSFQAPLLFLSVSKAWHALALSTPRLWAVLPIEIWSGKSYPPLAIVELWLERSRRVPLTFSLCQMTGWGDDDILASKLIHKLMKHLDRWADVTLKLDCAMSVRALTKHRNVAPRLLRSMDITFNLPFRALHVRDIDELSQTLLLFTDAPRFSSLVVHGANVFQHIDVPRVHWGGLTEIRLSEVDSVYTCLDLFAMCKNLVRCSLGVVATESEDVLPPTVGAITLPGLSSLTISLDELGMREIFGRLCVPQLRELSVSSVAMNWPQDSFTSMLERSQCSLTKVSFFNTRMLAADFSDLLSHGAMASLASLAVQEHGWLPEGWSCLMSKDTIERMSAVDAETDAPLLAPHLQSLVLNGRCVEDDYGKAVVDMVLARWERRTLTQFSWTNQNTSADIDEKEFTRLGVAELEGLGLSIGRIGSTWWDA
ncbi:hypothetical protein BDZ89DRAFT_1160360 [Hymenopellis radicata]|nr:hypothetical protein BDZ89DRAFT_1160360 [Hymenopellis radicata]